MPRSLPLPVLLISTAGCAWLAASDDLPDVTGMVALDPLPVAIYSALDVQCTQPTPEQARISGEDPHHERTAQVFANPLAATALAAGAPQLPPGSILVKVKRTLPRPTNPADGIWSCVLADPDADAVILYTVMIKHPSGYRPESGDWEYGVIDGAHTRWLQRGALQSCIDCHGGFGGHDFLSRDYQASARAAMAPGIFPAIPGRSLP